MILQDLLICHCDFITYGEVRTRGGRTHGAIAIFRTVLGKFRELMPLLTNRYINIKTRGVERVLTCVCVCSVLIYSGEC